MTFRTRWLILPTTVLVAAGCRSTCCHKIAPPSYQATAQVPPLPVRAAPERPPAELLPPASPPAPEMSAPAGGVPPLKPAEPPPNIPPSPSSNFAAPPAPAAVPDKSEPSARLLEPEFGESTTAEPPAPKSPPAGLPAEPSVKPAPSEAKSSPASALPVGIADFANALDDRVTAGRKPAIEGLDWLKASGYRSALLLRRPNESDDGDRKQFVDRGIKFASLDVSAAGLTKAKSDEFNRIVSDSTGHPLFVYDADGSLAGPLWYLYFRRVEGLGDDPARVRAGRLGLKADAPSGERAALWQAAQRLVK
ncbi:MAG: hypothetical protein U0746_14440 [Gemmataceae bacterium]